MSPVRGSFVGGLPVVTVRCLPTAGGQARAAVVGKPGGQRPAKAAIRRRTAPLAAPGSDQFLLWSTRRFFLIQGIMSRSLAPTTSISCCAVNLRRAVIDG